MTITLTDEDWEQLCYWLGYAESQLSKHDSKEQARQVERLYHKLQNQNTVKPNENLPTGG